MAQTAWALAKLNCRAATPKLQHWAETLILGDDHLAWTGTTVACALVTLDKDTGLGLAKLVLISDLRAPAKAGLTRLPRTEQFQRTYISLHPLGARFLGDAYSDKHQDQRRLIGGLAA